MTTEKIDTIQKALDYAIRDHENLKEISGYEIDGRVYNNYMSNEAFEEELREMKPEIRKQFDDAPGGELKQKRGRYGVYPPKMACFGSSSRFICNKLKDVKNIVFEYGLPTEVGGEAQLDAYIQAKKIEIFIEAKCREIYKEHYGKKAYKEVYEFLHEWNPKFDFNEENMTFYYNDEAITYFDLKQFICHFLGIAAAILQHKIRPEVRFLYLIYNPEKIADDINELYKDKISTIYKRAKTEIGYFEIWLFDAIVEFQKKHNLKISETLDYSFEFYVVDQDSCKEFIK